MRRGLSVDGLALASAFWCRYCYGETDSGAPIEPNDPDWPRLQALAREAKAEPRAWLGMRDIFADLGTNAQYVDAFSRALAAIYRDGTRATLARYLAGS